MLLPSLTRANDGIRVKVNQLFAALGIEFRLLRSERSLVVVMPLAIFLSILEVAFYNIPPDVSYSAAYATNTAKLLLLFVLGITVFYTGEAMHRDREVRIEPVLWAAPAANSVLLLSKWLGGAFADAFFGSTGVVWPQSSSSFCEVTRPVDFSAYLIVYGSECLCPA